MVVQFPSGNGLCPPIGGASHFVTPAKAGVQAACHRRPTWIPAFAGMTCILYTHFPPIRIAGQIPKEGTGEVMSAEEVIAFM